MDRHTRRDIRRAMGPEALDHIGRLVEVCRIIEQRLNWHHTQLDSAHADILVLSERHQKLLDLIEQQAKILRLHQTSLESHAEAARSLWQRLRWLITGR